MPHEKRCLVKLEKYEWHSVGRGVMVLFIREEGQYCDLNKLNNKMLLGFPINSHMKLTLVPSPCANKFWRTHLLNIKRALRGVWEFLEHCMDEKKVWIKIWGGKVLAEFGRAFSTLSPTAIHRGSEIWGGRSTSRRLVNQRHARRHNIPLVVNSQRHSHKTELCLGGREKGANHPRWTTRQDIMVGHNPNRYK